MFGALLVTIAIGGEVAVEDTTGCVDPIAVRAALDGVEGADRVDLAVSVLPEGDLRGLKVIWAGRHERDLEVVAGDCDQVPTLIAVATERVIADLPSRLKARRAVLLSSVGAGIGGGVDAWAPRLSLWTDSVGRGPVAPTLGGAFVVGTQPVGTGATRTLGLGLRVGALARTDRVRADLGLTGGFLAGRGSGLTTKVTNLVPQLGVRTGVSSTGPFRLGGFVEVPLIRPVWSIVGGASVPEPLVRLSLEIGWIVGER